METTVKVGDKEYAIIKTGRAHAAQVLELTRWLSKYGAKAMSGISSDDAEDNGGMVIIQKILDNLDTDAIIDLFQSLTGCPKEDAEVYFDVGILVDTAFALYEEQPGIRRLINRFFSPANSTQDSDESSTTSEQPTDGQTK